MSLPGPADPRTAPGAAHAGRHVVAQLEQHGYHPVLVVGAPSAGKSTLLASLLAYLRLDAADEAQVHPGPWLAQDAAACGDAARVFHTDVPRFIDGEAPAPSDTAQPRVVPVVVQPADGLPEMRFAFVEVTLVPSRDGTPDGVDSPPDDVVSALLLGWPRPLSVVYAAPCTHLPTWTEVAPAQRACEPALAHAADAAMAAFMERYRAVRVPAHHDDHLFLLTRWDAQAPPGPPSGRFIAPALDDVASVARARWPRAFAAFRTLGLAGAGAPRRQLLQYCSAIVRGRSIVPTDAELHAQLQRYPRVLWTWLYANAARGAGLRRGLFAAPHPRATRWRQRLDRQLATVLRVLGV